jgi:chromate transporter
MDSTASHPRAPGNLGEVARLFLKLGTIAFGGPAAHIALMRREVVQRLRWIDDQRFLDLVGACNLIPGPNSTELAIHLGYYRAGWPGLIVAGTLFIIPAMLSVLGFAWLYVTYGSLPQVDWLLYGIKPVIIAVVLQALWGLAKTALKGRLLLAVALLGLALYLFAGLNEIVLLFGGGLLVLLARAGGRFGRPGGAALVLPGLGLPITAQVAGAASVAYSPSLLFWTFVKIGSVLYGSGYVLLAFLRSDFVERLGWLSDQQLVDAVAIGQFTPGPVFTTATFIGYLVGGLPGALLATLGIFLPSFIFVALSGPLVPKLRASTLVAALLDGVNASALALMAGVTLQLAQASLVDPLTVLLTLVALALLLRTNLNSAWLVLAGGAVGVVARFITG